MFNHLPAATFGREKGSPAGLPFGESKKPKCRKLLQSDCSAEGRLCFSARDFDPQSLMQRMEAPFPPPPPPSVPAHQKKVAVAEPNVRGSGPGQLSEYDELQNKARSPTPEKGLLPKPPSSEAPPGKALNPELFVPPPLNVGPHPVVLFRAFASFPTAESKVLNCAFDGTDQPDGQ